MRQKYEYRMASRENYEQFISEHSDIKLSFTEWQNIIYTFNYNFRDYLLETGDKAKLPWGIGEFAVNKKKMKSTFVHPETGKEYRILPVDWKKTREKGKYIYHLNKHTNGYRYKWKWFISSSRLFKADIWVFKPSRVSSRLINHYIQQSEEYQHIYKEWHLFA
jgi:hypothetical protein